MKTDISKNKEPERCPHCDYCPHCGKSKLAPPSHSYIPYPVYVHPYTPNPYQYVYPYAVPYTLPATVTITSPNWLTTGTTVTGGSTGGTTGTTWTVRSV